MPKKFRLPAALLVPILLLALAVPALAAFDEQHRFDGSELTVRNLIGEIRISGHEGSGFDVRVHVRGKDASPGLLLIDAETGAQPQLIVTFPIDKERQYVYPALGPNSKTSFTARKGDSSWLSALLHSVSQRKITVRGSGSGVAVWADLEILVPAGGTLVLDHGVGNVFAEGVSADLRLNSRAGSIEATGIRGDLLADTGSGSMTIRDVEGALYADTGSGQVVVERCRGESILIDTGSGNVSVESVETPSLNVDTGSGSVAASAIRAESALIDTGSGEVELELTGMGSGDFRIDTGSGAVTLALPANASAEVHADTGGGSISVDLSSDVRMMLNERDEIRFRVGEGAADVHVDTGSGSIRFVQSE
jgi:hypothetical protein